MALLSHCVQLPSFSVSISTPCSCERSGLGFSSSSSRLFRNGLFGSCGGAFSGPGRQPQMVIRMGLRAVEAYDGAFQLKPECERNLKALLSSEVFCNQVSEQAGVAPLEPGVKYVFSGELFQPVPWSVATKHGMPQEFEKYFHDRANFAIINVPPNFMFQAKVFHPSRLCAVYKRVQDLAPSSR